MAFSSLGAWPASVSAAYAGPNSAMVTAQSMGTICFFLTVRASSKQAMALSLSATEPSLLRSRYALPSACMVLAHSLGTIPFF